MTLHIYFMSESVCVTLSARGSPLSVLMNSGLLAIVSAIKFIMPAGMCSTQYLCVLGWANCSAYHKGIAVVLCNV